MPKDPSPEFSLAVNVNDVPPGGTGILFEADERVRDALARRFGILEVTRLAGRAKVRPYRKSGLTLDCDFEAEVVQACVVTLDPVVQSIRETFVQRYLPEDMIEPEAAEAAIEFEVDIDAEDAPEAMSGHGIDVGAAVAERLALAIDPYPRKAEAAFSRPREGAEDAPEKLENPFAALEKLKKTY
ncbi:MAG: DUF177 domain-containing protein [Parvibaculum sp.]|nr:DUF177 domain-containing protein [Parvibaculum sp.]